jgi:hygromycin-B 7''-O-kinase
MDTGTVLVALLGSTHALKLYPPFLRDHHAFECAMLARVGGQLQVPTPVLVKSGEHDGWPWLLMTQLHGEPLTTTWHALEEDAKCRLLSTLGALAAEVHALPVGGMGQHAPAWTDFIAAQRQRCLLRHTRVGLPAHLLDQLEAFVAGPLPQGRDVMLTGEYTPMNLLTRQGRLCGMFDFGDGLVGPREYDWLGPLAFLAAGHAARCDAFFSGYGVNPDAAQRLALMRLLLLHRYSNLPAQIAHPQWQAARSFEELTKLIWPS